MLFEPSPNPMAIQLPSPGRTPGPNFAVAINDALTIIGVHDHTTDKGSAITPPALNLNSDVDFQGNNIESVRALRLNSQDSELPATASEANSVYVKDGDLYFANGTSASVRITDGPALDNSGTGGIDGDYSTSAASIYYDEPTSTYRFLRLPGLRAYIQSNNVDIQNDQGDPGLTFGSARLWQNSDEVYIAPDVPTDALPALSVRAAGAYKVEASGKVQAHGLLLQPPASPAAVAPLQMIHSSGSGGLSIEANATGFTISDAPANSGNILTKTAGNKVGFFGAPDATANVMVNGAQRITGNLTANGTTLLTGSLTANGPTLLTSSLQADGPAVLSSTLQVNDIIRGRKGALFGVTGQSNQIVDIVGDGGTAGLDLASTQAVDFDWRMQVSGAAGGNLVFESAGGLGTQVVSVLSAVRTTRTSFPAFFGVPLFRHTTCPAGNSTVFEPGYNLSTSTIDNSVVWERIMPYAGTVVGVSYFMWNGPASTIFCIPTVSGTATTLQVSGSSSTATQGANLANKGSAGNTFTAGQRLGARINMATGPSSVTVAIAIFVEFTAPG